MYALLSSNPCRWPYPRGPGHREPAFVLLGFARRLRAYLSFFVSFVESPSALLLDAKKVPLLLLPLPFLVAIGESAKKTTQKRRLREAYTPYEPRTE